MEKSNLLRGTFILTLGTIFSKVLGLLYIFPFYALVGSEGGELYTYAYVPYMIFISIATMGIPLAISKFIAKYNALGQYQVGRHLFKSGLLLMSITGILSFLLLYILAPYFSPMIVTEEMGIEKMNDVTMTIRMVSFALIIVPVMSLLRGFFQGHESMGPTAVSQVIEQIIRIMFILISAYIVMEVIGGKLSTAIGFATFGAFIGAVGALCVLIWYWFKRKSYLDELLIKDQSKITTSTKEMYKELLSYAAPFVFVGLANPLYQLIDEFTFNRAMSTINLAHISGEAFAMITFYGHKLVLIPVSLATAFALTLIPTITKTYVENNMGQLKSYLDQTFQIIFYLTFPAVIGLSLLSGPALSTFYSFTEMGSMILKWYAPVAILFAFFTVTAAVLQGINKQKYTAYSLVVGLVIKLSLNSFLIIKFAAIGSILATAIGYCVSIAINLWVIRKYANYRYNFLLRRTALMIGFTIIMALAVSFSTYLASYGISYQDGKLQALSILVIGGTIGIGTYLFLSVKSKLVFHLFGNKVAFLKKLQKEV